MNEYDPNSLKNITFIIKDKNGNEIKPESIALSVQKPFKSRFENDLIKGK